MNYRKILSFLGIILIILGLSMTLPIFWSLYYGDSDYSAFIISSALTSFIGLVFFKLSKIEGDFHNKEAFVVVSLSWLIAATFGALPYMLSGTFTSYADAFFETMSGFTTTGASVLSDIESLPHGILFWRSLTHWLGGMGIIVLLVALLSAIGAGGMQMFKAESPGPITQKIMPRISQTAKILWYTYLTFTVSQTLLLWISGMTLFDALCHTFGTVATGGFATKNASIGYYESPVIQWIIIIFMFLSGANFALYYQALRGKNLVVFWKNSEFKLYSLIILIAVLILSSNLIISGEYNELSNTIRDASFQVVSIITTTGYATADFAQWSFFSQSILILLMFIGGCAGSTGGSIKVGRILVLFKQTIIELRKTIHPRAILNLKIDGQPVTNEIAISIMQFFFIFILITAVSTFIMASMGLDLVTAFTSVAATISNVGPGLGKVGPVANYGFIPDAGKYLLSFLMMIGRLELYTVLALFLPSFWRD